MPTCPPTDRRTHPLPTYLGISPSWLTRPAGAACARVPQPAASPRVRRAGRRAGWPMLRPPLAARAHTCRSCRRSFGAPSPATAPASIPGPSSRASASAMARRSEYRLQLASWWRRSVSRGSRCINNVTAKRRLRLTTTEWLGQPEVYCQFPWGRSRTFDFTCRAFRSLLFAAAWRLRVCTRGFASLHVAARLPGSAARFLDHTAAAGARRACARQADGMARSPCFCSVTVCAVC